MPKIKKQTDILILGAGIGGYEAFRSLQKQLRRHKINKKITLIDKNNYFTFTPMLHEVASGSIQPNQAAIPIRQCIHKTPHEFWQATVEKIDPRKKCVKTSEGSITYKYCVVALGSKTNFFNTPGTPKLVEHVRNLPAAIQLHQNFIELLEDKSIPHIKFTVVGGGATGVELAGQFCHLAHNDIKELYPEKKLTVTIIQSGNQLMKFSNPRLRKAVAEQLKKEGVKIIFNARAKKVSAQSILLDNGKSMKSHLTAWTTGFENTGANYCPNEFCEKGLIKVNSNLASPKAKSLYAIGDIAAAQHPKTKDAYPKLGEIAHKQGEYVAKHIAASIKKRKIPAFSYKTKGELIPIGDWFAVAHIGPFTFRGRFAWWLRRTVYLAFIPGFLRKLRIVIDWTLHGLGFRHMVNINFELDNNS